MNLKDRPSESETQREGKPYTSLLFLCFVGVSHMVWYKLTFKETLFHCCIMTSMTLDSVFWCLDSTCHSALLFILDMLIGDIVVEYKLRLLACWTTKCTVKVSQFTGIHERENFLMNRTWCHCLM